MSVVVAASANVTIEGMIVDFIVDDIDRVVVDEVSIDSKTIVQDVIVIFEAFFDTLIVVELDFHASLAILSLSISDLFTTTCFPR